MFISSHVQNFALPLAELYVIHLSVKPKEQVAALYSSTTTWCTSQFPQFCLFEIAQGAPHLLPQFLTKICNSTCPVLTPGQ